MRWRSMIHLPVLEFAGRQCTGMTENKIALLIGNDSFRDERLQPLATALRSDLVRDLIDERLCRRQILILG